MQPGVHISRGTVVDDGFQVGPVLTIMDVQAPFDIWQQQGSNAGTRGLSGPQKNKLVVVANYHVTARKYRRSAVVLNRLYFSFNQ